MCLKAIIIKVFFNNPKKETSLMMKSEETVKIIGKKNEQLKIYQFFNAYFTK